MDNPLYRLIDFPTSVTTSGALSMFQSPLIPFQIKKVLIIKDIQERGQRGGHTHHRTNQILVCIQGGCTVDLENGTEKETVILKSGAQGLVLYPYTWHVMRDFEKSTMLFVMADTEYDEKDYIRSYDDFVRFVKQKNSSHPSP